MRFIVIIFDYYDNPYPRENIDHSFIFHLFRASGDRSLLPNVREIRCGLSPSVDMSILCLAGDTLRDLVIIDPNQEPTPPDKMADKQIADALRRLLS